MADSYLQTVELDSANFDQEVLESPRPVLVDFWATWCGPCKTLAPTIDRLASEYGGRVKVAKIDIDEASGVAEKFGVRGVPNVIIFQDGIPITSIAGAQPHASYKRVLDEVLGGADSDQITDIHIQDAEARIRFILSASTEEVQGALDRQPTLSKAPIKDGMHPLEIALRYGLPTDKIELLASYFDELSFEELVGLGRIEEVREAIAANPELVRQPANDGASPLTIAILNAQSECTDLLLELGADPDQIGNGLMQFAPIELAVFQKDAELVERLLNQGADPNRRSAHTGGTLLHLAAQMSDQALIELFVERGVDPKTPNHSGETAYEATLNALSKALANEKRPQEIENLKKKLKQHEALRASLS